MIAKPRLLLVVPCHNEASRLRPDAFLHFLASGCDTGLLFVDDGSTDATPAILADLAERGMGRIEVLTLPRNVGKAAAVQRGVLAALDQTPELVGYWDADLSTPLTALPEFLDVLKTHPEIDIVMGARVKLLGRDIRRRPVRHYLGRAFSTAASLTLSLGVYDTQCGAKVFRASPPVKRVFATPFEAQWIFDVEILSRYIAVTGMAECQSRVIELPLKTWTDVPGSKLRARHAIRAMWDLAVIWRRLSGVRREERRSKTGV